MASANFTFKLNSTSTNTSVDFETLLTFRTASVETLGDDQIATCKYNIPATTLNDASNPLLTLSFLASQHALNDDSDDVTYSMDSTAIAACFDELELWDVQESSPNSSKNAYGYANRKPYSSVPAAGTAAKTGTEAAASSGTLAFHESILPKRVFSAFGADIMNLLENQAKLEAEINGGTDGSTYNFTTNDTITDTSYSAEDLASNCLMSKVKYQLQKKFADSAADQKSGIGYKIWTQAVGLSQNSTVYTSATVRAELVQRLEDMLDAATVSNEGEPYGDEILTAPFVFAAGDEIHFDVIFNAATADSNVPDFENDASDANPHHEQTLKYRMQLVVVDAA